jgi:hypothetical protein
MKFAELELAFAFVNFSDPSDNSAYISRSTGETFVCSDLAGVDELPDDIDSSDDYVEIPHRHDLDLGTQLVWDFVDREIPGLKDKVREFFAHRGAYGRYKSFLEELDLIEKWHRFEDDCTREALLKWCEDAGISIDE